MKMSMRRKSIIVAVGAALIGGIVGAMLLAELTYLAVWLLVPTALESAQFLKSLDGSPSMGFLFGAGTGLALVPRILAALAERSQEASTASEADIQVCRRFAAALAILLGLSVTMPFVVAAIAVAIGSRPEANAELREQAKLLPAFLVLPFPVLIWGNLLFFWGYRAFNKKRGPNRRREYFGDFMLALRAACRLKPDESVKLEPGTLHSPLPLEETRQRFEEACAPWRSLPVVILRSALIENEKRFRASIRPITNSEGQLHYEILFSGPATNVQDVYIGQLSNSLEGSVLKVTSRSNLNKRFMFWMWFGMLTIMSAMLLFLLASVLISVATGTSKNPLANLGATLAGMALLGVMWIYGIILLRYTRWFTRKHQGELMGFLSNALHRNDESVVD